MMRCIVLALLLAGCSSLPEGYEVSRARNPICDVFGDGARLDCKPAADEIRFGQGFARRVN